MIENPRDRPVTERRGYFARFFGLARGIGGEFRSVRNRSSVRFSASSRGNRSSGSSFRLLGARRFGFCGFAFMGEV